MSHEIRKEILRRAEKATCGQRNTKYGEPEDNFAAIAGLWSWVFHTKYPSDSPHWFTPHDVALFMMAIKLARESNLSQADNLIDMCGYAACAGSTSDEAIEEELFPNTGESDVCNICGKSNCYWCKQCEDFTEVCEEEGRRTCELQAVRGSEGAATGEASRWPNKRSSSAKVDEEWPFGYGKTVLEVPDDVVDRWSPLG